MATAATVLNDKAYFDVIKVSCSSRTLAVFEIFVFVRIAFVVLSKKISELYVNQSVSYFERLSECSI